MNSARSPRHERLSSSKSIICSAARGQTWCCLSFGIYRLNTTHLLGTSQGILASLAARLTKLQIALAGFVKCPAYTA